MKVFETYQFLQGIELDQNIVELSSFKLLAFADWEDHLHSKITVNQKDLYNTIIQSADKSSVILKIDVKATDYNSAIETAREHCYNFEFLLSFIIADLNFDYSIGTKDLRKQQRTTIITLDPDGLGFNNKTHTFHRNYVLKPSNVSNKIFGYDRLWSLMSKTSTNAFEKRIIIAIQWIGKALWERDNTKCFFQIMIAFEALLQFQPKSLISSSTANQISEWGAFLTSDNYDERMNTLKKIKKLYELRSKIVHSGSTKVSHDELYDALSLVKNIIINLVTLTDYKNIDSIEKLQEVINKKKF